MFWYDVGVYHPGHDDHDVAASTFPPTIVTFILEAPQSYVGTPLALLLLISPMNPNVHQVISQLSYPGGLTL